MMAPPRSPAINVTRSWNDANRDYIPQCDLTNPAANGECGAMSDQNFGRPTLSTNYDRDTLVGWGKRGYNWEFSTGVQHELLAGVSVNVAYFRRAYGNFTVLDNAPNTQVTRFRDLLLGMTYGDAEVRPLLDLEGLKQWMPSRVDGYRQLAAAVDRFGTIDAFVKEQTARWR